ncbi:hypothetical protein, partial [Enterococcus avium]|uniref:hypothetical protein n=1 Tax=Enterococcus avium TaxID=33945 RepID=UPI0032E52B12
PPYTGPYVRWCERGGRSVGFPLYSISPEKGIDQGFFATIIGSIVTFALAFVFTYKFGWNETNDEIYKTRL